MSVRIILLLVLALASNALAAKPNVLFIVSDDLNNSLGCYGAPTKTPNLDRLAARAVRFDNAYCQYPLCGPSRCSFMTGLRPNTTGVLQNGLTVRHKLKDVVTLPQLFRQNGYHVARVGKIYHLGIPGDVGKPGPDDPASWDTTFNPPGAEFKTDGDEYDPTPKMGQGFRRVQGKGDGHEQADFQSADEAIKILRDHKDKPFFLAVGFVRPHVPVIAPKTYFDLHDINQIKLPEVPSTDRDDIPAAAFMRPVPNWEMSEADCRGSKWAYYACVSFMDAQAGRVLDELDRLKLTDNTIVVFVGDHGYALGEHSAWQKMMLFEPVARVPLIIAAPGVKAATTSALVESIDIAPTVASLAGLSAPAQTEGKSLQPVLAAPDKPFKPAAYTQLSRKESAGRSVRGERFRYTEWDVEGKIQSELYDEKADPAELTNLAKDPKHSADVEQMRKLLHEVLPPGAAAK